MIDSNAIRDAREYARYTRVDAWRIAGWLLESYSASTYTARQYMRREFHDMVLRARLEQTLQNIERGRILRERQR